MRYRVKTYGIYLNGDTVIVQVNVPITLTTVSGGSTLDDASKRKVTEAIRLIVDETVGEVFCSSMQKSRIYEIYGSNYGWDCGIAFAIPTGKTIASTDQFTIEMDWGDTPGASPSADQLAEFFGVTLLQGYEFMTDSEVTDELEDIMQALDPELEQEVEYPEGSGTYMTKAQAITAEAMQIINDDEEQS